MHIYVIRPYEKDLTVNKLSSATRPFPHHIGFANEKVLEIPDHESALSAVGQLFPTSKIQTGIKVVFFSSNYSINPLHSLIHVRYIVSDRKG